MVYNVSFHFLYRQNGDREYFLSIIINRMNIAIQIFISFFHKILLQHVDKVLGKALCLPSLMLHGLFVTVHLFPIMSTNSLPHLNKSLVASTSVITFCLAMNINKFLKIRNEGFKYMPCNVKSPLPCLFFKGL